MDWVRAHPYTSALSVVGVFLFAIILIVQGRSTVAPQGTGAWSAEGSIPSSPTYQGGSLDSIGGSVPNPVLQTQGSAGVFSKPLAPENQADTSTEDFSDMASLLARISGSSQKSQVSGSVEQSDIAKAYAMVPQTLIATTTLKKRAPREQALYDYGNEVGSLIQSYENQHPNQAQILKNQMEDRSDPSKAAALVSLAQGLLGIGQSMQKMEGVPTDIGGMHTALARSYAEIGGKLAQVPQARGDQELVAAILAYDASVHTFVRNYAALATYFSISNVVFSPQDAGVVFSFTAAPSM